MFAYCGNNPINHKDSYGTFLASVLDFANTALNEISKAVSSVQPIYAGIGTLAGMDGPFLGGDTLALVGLAAVTLYTVGVGIYNAAKNYTKSESKEKVKADAIVTQTQSSKVIYRYGGTNPGNLTPKDKDRYTGLSFSTVPKPGAAMTTIEAINSTGIVYAIQDGPSHVSVRPIGGSMDDWIEQGSSSKWTQAVKSVVIKWDG